MKIKKGDTIIVLSGKDKGKTGTVEKAFPKTGKVLVPGVNIYKRHKKKQDEKNPGGIIEKPRALNVSKVALVDKKTKKPTRVGYVLSKGDKVRIGKRSGAMM